MNKVQQLKRLLKEDRALVFAGVYDALSARVAEDAGVDGLWVSGYAVAATFLGKPDVGLVTLSEMAGIVARICDAVRIPVICDGECGYGNAMNVIRTVREFIRAGAAGMQLDDKEQEICPFLDIPIKLLQPPEAVLKMKAVAAARGEDDFVLVANTEHDVNRAELYCDAGASAVLFHWAKVIGKDAEPAWIAAVKKVQAKGAAPVAVQVPFIDQIGKDELYQHGFKIIVPAVDNLYATAAVQQAMWRHYKRVGSTDGFQPMIRNQADFLPLIDEAGTRAAVDAFLGGEAAAPPPRRSTAG